MAMSYTSYLEGELEKVRAELEEFQILFNMQHDIDMEIFKRWHEEGYIPTNIWPDYGWTVIQLDNEIRQLRNLINEFQGEK